MPGFDWGTLPEADQKKWKAYACDWVSNSEEADPQEVSKAAGERKEKNSPPTGQKRVEGAEQWEESGEVDGGQRLAEQNTGR